MSTRVYIPYVFGDPSRPIPYQYESIIRHVDRSNFDIIGFSLPSLQSVHCTHLNEVELPDSPVFIKRARMIMQSLGQYDVLHTGGGPKLRYFLSQGVHARNPGLWHVHTLHIDLAEEKTRRREYKRRLVSMADKVVAVSQHTASTARHRFGVSPDVIYNGIDTEYFRPDRDPPELIEKLGATSPVFLFVGQFQERKRPDDVLSVARAFPDATFLLRGDGPLMGTVSAIAADLENVRLVDPLEKSTLAKVYANVDGFLIPSIREGCPSVVLEALSSGTPVVGYEATSMPELVENGKTGYLCDVGDIDGLTDALRELTDPKRRDHMGECAREYVLTNHRLEQMAEQYQDLYKQEIGT